jgi:hypothetical protein
VGVGTLGSARSDSELLVVHATERTASHTLLQNMSIVLTGNVSLVSAHQTDIKKVFSIGCFKPIPKIIISIDCLKTADTNKCPA